MRRGRPCAATPRPTPAVSSVLAANFRWPVADHGSAAFPDGHGVAIPIYDVRLMGYPQRMRDYNERQKRLRAEETRGD